MAGVSRLFRHQFKISFRLLPLFLVGIAWVLEGFNNCVYEFLVHIDMWCFICKRVIIALFVFTIVLEAAIRYVSKNVRSINIRYYHIASLVAFISPLFLALITICLLLLTFIHLLYCGLGGSVIFWMAANQIRVYLSISLLAIQTSIHFTHLQAGQDQTSNLKWDTTTLHKWPFNHLETYERYKLRVFCWIFPIIFPYHTLFRSSNDIQYRDLT